jgi:prophage tail gpP-like protein
MTLPARTPYAPEVAIVEVRGSNFYDWESVWVQHRFAEAWPIFRFTAAERTPPSTLATLQFMPGDFATIYLGGVLAIRGVIVTRQTAYDAKNHAVQLEGYGVTWLAARASHLDEDGNFDGMSFIQAAARVLAPFAGQGVGWTVDGVLDSTPFARLQIEPGETIWNFLERIARVRGILIGTDSKGNFVFTGPHSTPPTDQLVEGQNILRCQAILSAEYLYSEYDVRGQTAASDSNAGSQASEVQGQAGGALQMYSPQLTPAEQPLWSQGEAFTRANYEHVWHDYTYATATITVQGWLRNNGDIWRVGDTVHVTSPMAVLDMDMAIQTATFTQDRQNGTLTSLELVDPRLQRGTSDFNLNNPNVPAPDTSQPAQPSPPNTPQAEPPPPFIQGPYIPF